VHEHGRYAMNEPHLPPDPATIIEAWHRLRYALGAAGIGTWHLDLRSGVATFDESLNRIFGLAPVDTRAPLTSRLERIHPDDRERVRTTVEDAMRRRAEFTLEFRIVRPDGEVRWLRDRGRVVTDDDGKAVAATGAVMDVTERRRLEEHDRMLADATHVLAAASDHEKALETITAGLVPRFAAFCAVHLRHDGEEAARVVAMRGDERLAPEPRQIDDVLSTGGPIAMDGALVLPLRAASTSFGAIAFVSPTRFDDNDVAFASELTERVALSIDRARLFRDLERANRVKDEFLATLSHELRTPLNAVLGWTRMLRRGTVPLERTAAILETIERNAAAQMQLVEELLDLSAMAAGGLRLNVTPVDLRDLIGGAVETIRPAADGKGLRVSINIVDPLDEIAGDAARLRQVLWNLLANAVKFTPAGGQVEVRVVASANDVEITVRDTGPGIPAEFLPHVFEPFRQADSSSTRTVGGLGLGLAIVRHIVEAHGGTVAADSEGPGQGTVLSVRLPSGRLHAQQDAAAGPGTLRGRRVLAVDDDESTQELVATMLLMYGVSVRSAGRAAQALQILSQWKPDVLLTDIAMPGEDGYALMRRIRSMPPPLGSIPAVALTAYTDPQSVQNAFAAGFDAHLGKPLEPHVLADALAKVLRLRRAG
jgi:PAS domain S-box-containing protein